jgi:hypothetical protein
MSDMYAPNQQAVREDGSGPAEEGTGGSGSGAEPKSLDAMTKDELLAEAEVRGVEVDASMTKAEIREAIGA